MSKGAAAQTDVLKYIMNGTAPSWAGASNFYIALHTADPTVSGNQSTNEVSYGSYARIPVAASTSGWTVSGSSASNNNALLFPTCTSGGATATHISVGTASSGTGEILYYGPLQASLAISVNIQPKIAAGVLQVTES